MKYRARVGLDVPVSAAETQRILEAKESGKPIPFDERKMKRVEPGEITESIPGGSVEWMLAQGLIEEVEEAPQKRVQR